MRYLVSLGVSLILLACTVHEKRGFERKLVFPAKATRAQMSDSEDSISARKLQLVIRFVDESKPFRKGLWPFSRDQLSVIVELSNTSDSAMLIEPFLKAPMGNPGFSIQTADGVPLYSNNLAVVDVLPAFIEIKQGESYRDTINLLETEQYHFDDGAAYNLKAGYAGGYEACYDSTGHRRSVWNGHIRSNTLHFVYPD
jgi:hypothetical protein